MKTQRKTVFTQLPKFLHKMGFLHNAAAHGLHPETDRAFLTYVRTMEDLTAIETVIRHHAAVLEKLRQEADAEVLA